MPAHAHQARTVQHIDDPADDFPLVGRNAHPRLEGTDEAVEDIFPRVGGKVCERF